MRGMFSDECIRPGFHGKSRSRHRIRVAGLLQLHLMSESALTALWHRDRHAIISYGSLEGLLHIHMVFNRLPTS